MTSLSDVLASSGNERSTIRPSTTAASAFRTTPCGSACCANAETGVPAGTLRWDPSGRVIVMSVMKRDAGPPTLIARFARSYGGQPSRLANRSGERSERSAKVGRHGRTRTVDLLHVKQAL